VLPCEQRRLRAACDRVRQMPTHQPDTEPVRAAPVRSLQLRALPDPPLDEPSQPLEPGAIAGQHIRSSEPYELEMPIELPQVLGVADDPHVTVIERLAEYQRRRSSGVRIDVPAWGETEVEARAEQLEASGEHIVRR